MSLEFFLVKIDPHWREKLANVRRCRAAGELAEARAGELDLQDQLLTAAHAQADDAEGKTHAPDRP